MVLLIWFVPTVEKTPVDTVVKHRDSFQFLCANANQLGTAALWSYRINQCVLWPQIGPFAASALPRNSTLTLSSKLDMLLDVACAGLQQLEIIRGSNLVVNI